MADLNPLKFQVAIQDDATKQLEKIETALNSLKDKTISVKVDGLSDLQQLLSSLQHIQVQNIGKDVGASINEAAKNLQKEAQDAIRTSLGNLAKDLVSIKEAIQHDNFTAFGKRIEQCAEAVNTLDDAFKKFHVTIGQDDGMRNFMTGLGEVIRNVRQTMGQLHGNDPSYHVSPDALSRSINIAKNEADRLNTQLTETERTIETFGAKGFDTTRLERYKTLLIDVRDNLSLIEKNSGVHPLTGLTASQYLRSEDASRVTSLLNNELSYYKSIGNELERIAKLRGEINSLLSTPGINGGSRQELSYVLSGLDLREGLFGKFGVRDAFQSINTDAYREQMQQAVGVISRVNSEIRQGVKDSKASQTENEKWAKSVDVAKQKIVDLEMKIASLKATKDRGDFLHVDTSSLTAYIAEMKNLLTIMRSIEAGMKIHGTAESFASSAGYRNTWKLADAEAGVVKKNSDEKEKNALATQRLNDAERQLALSLKSTTHEMRGQSQMLSDLKSLATQYLGVWGGQQFLNNIIKIGGQLESQRLSLTAILGQRSYANDLFEKVQDLALKSPFGVVQLDQYTKNLSAFGFQYNELFDMTKRLADIAAGTGTDFGRLALALGHVRSEMALTGYTLRQFSMANVPMLKMLAENLGVTTAEIRKMVREKKVSYEDVEKVLKDLTDEGGMFYNMQEVMSEAVSAKFKNLKDAMDIMYGQMAESVLGDMLKGIAATLTDITKRWQTFGTVLLTTASIIGAYKMYMHLLNVGIRTNTINLLQNVAATKTLTAADIEQMLEKKLLTAQDIALALAEGRLTLEQAKGALIAAGYTEAIIAEIAATNGLSAAMTGLKASSAGMLAMLTNPWTAALLGVEAVIGAVMAYKTWSDNIQDDVNRALERAKTASQEIGKYLMEADKEGKPTSESDLRTEIEQMKTILKNSELYTEELQNQVDLAPSLSAEYDVLIGKMKTVNEELSKSSSNIEAIIEAIKHTSGDFMSTSFSENLRWFSNDDIGKNLGQLENSRGKFVSMMSGALKQYRDNMQEITNAMANQEQMVIQNGDSTRTVFIDADFRAKLLNKTLEEQLRILSSNGNETYWNYFVSSMEHANSGFSSYVGDMKNRLDKMNEDFSEVLEDDIPRMMESLWTDKGFHSKEEFRKWANSNSDAFSQMLTDIEKVLAEKAPSIAGMLRGMLTGWLNDNSDWTLFEIPMVLSPEEQERMRQNLLRKGFGKVGENSQNTLNKFAQGLGKSKDFFDNAFIAEYFKGGDDASSGIEAMGKRWKEVKKLIESNKKVGHSTPKEILDEWEKLSVADKFFHFDKKKGKKEQDENAKELRERVRILKEAADSYKYWRDKVGDKGAAGHVDEEFGKLLGEQGFKFENVKKFRETLAELRKEYEKKPKSKAMLEALKELDKEVAKLDRNDFEKGSEEFLSRMKAELDKLTRSWEIYNNVREATGDTSLAEFLSGRNDIATYRTLADAVKAKMTEDFSNLGVKKGIAFDMNLSDNEIEQEIFAAVPRETEESVEKYEERIKELIEEYKKWCDLQKDAVKEDIRNFASLLGGVVSYEAELKRINDKLARAKAANNALVGKTDEHSGKTFTQEMADKANEIAEVNADTEKLKLSSQYINLMNNSLGMTKSEVTAAASAVEKNLNDRLRTGTINAKEYADEMRKLHDITQEFNEKNALFSGVLSAFASGGLKGAQGFIGGRIQNLNVKENTEGLSDKEAKELESLKTLRDKIDNVVNSLSGFALGLDVVNGVLDGFGKAAQSLSKMFEALGKHGAAAVWSDINSAIAGITSVLAPVNNVVQSAMSGNVGGVVSSVLSAPVDMIAGPITAFANLHDNQLARKIDELRKEVVKITNNTNLIIKSRNRTLGYDTGDVLRYYASLYAPSQELIEKNKDMLFAISYEKEGFKNPLQRDLYNLYNNAVNGNGYQQQYQNLLNERQKYHEMYGAEYSKKDSSDEALEEYKQKIAELDEQIRYFSEDLAKELWSIDIKGWADQLSDALCSAFENGENAADAYRDTVTNILQQVMSKMMQLSILEPMFQNLHDKLFGNEAKNIAGVFDFEDPMKSMSAVTSTISEFFGSGGEGEKTITAALEFMTAFEHGLNQAGLSIKNKDTGNTLSSSIQGTSEETSTLLAGYVNALRQDVSFNRLMFTQFLSDFWPSYIEQVTSTVTSLKNIDNNVALIRSLLSDNGAIYVMISSMKSHLDNITNGNEEVHVR